MQTRKETAWKKSRKFGDVKGGRTRPKLADNIFARSHSLQRPEDSADLPIFICDNPSRDFFFPIGEQEVRSELARLPRGDWSEITHIWFRRFKMSDYEENELPLAEFSCGSGVRLITLYPWPRTMIWEHGVKKPADRVQTILARYAVELCCKNTGWVSRWSEESLKDFYIEHLLFHEIGHHVDWYKRRWSKANLSSREEAADQYAFCKTTQRSMIYKADSMLAVIA